MFLRKPVPPGWTEPEEEQQTAQPFLLSSPAGQIALLDNAPIGTHKAFLRKVLN